MRVYGWRKQLGDARDLVYRPVHAGLIPPSADLRPEMPPIVDQGQLGSCTANAIAAAHEFAQMKQHEKAFAPSRLFIYYNERAMEGTVKSDAGAVIRDGFKSISKQGVCPETSWPYNIAKFTQKPTAKCYAAAAKHKAVQYLAVTQTLDQMRRCLADGFPFVFGISVYESFESDTVSRSGIVPMPGHGEAMLGGHAICAVGYDDTTHYFLCRNSWGVDWGMGGYFVLPYDYLTRSSLASDMWAVRLVA